MIIVEANVEQVDCHVADRCWVLKDLVFHLLVEEIAMDHADVVARALCIGKAVATTRGEVWARPSSARVRELAATTTWRERHG